MNADAGGGFSHFSQEGGYRGAIASSISPSEFSLNGMDQEGDHKGQYELGNH